MKSTYCKFHLYLKYSKITYWLFFSSRSSIFLCAVCVLSHSAVSNSWDPIDCNLPGSSVHGILQARILEWVAIPSPGDLPDPGIEPRSPALRVDSLLTEPQGKHFLDRIFYFYYFLFFKWLIQLWIWLHVSAFVLWS